MDKPLSAGDVRKMLDAVDRARELREARERGETPEPVRDPLLQRIANTCIVCHGTGETPVWKNDSPTGMTHVPCYQCAKVIHLIRDLFDECAEEILAMTVQSMLKDMSGEARQVCRARDLAAEVVRNFLE